MEFSFEERGQADVRVNVHWVNRIGDWCDLGLRQRLFNPGGGITRIKNVNKSALIALF